MRIAPVALLMVAMARPVWAQGDGQAKYVFLLIGDGMASSQRMAAELYLRAAAQEGDTIAAPRLAMNKLAVQGLTTTHSADAEITDSAAAGTALSCGEKTNNGMVCMERDGATPLPTVAELAHRAGFKVGIVSTVSIDHATPACFYAHQGSRNSYYDIAMQLPTSGFAFFGGGAARGELQGQAEGKPSVVAAANEAGYKIVTNREALEACKPGGKVWAINPNTNNEGAMPYAIDAGDDDISLAEFTRQAIRLLDGPNGFFLMVEGGKIDWSCHCNDLGTTVREVLAFDEAVAEAIRFYEEHPDETLIIVTGDHETGALTMGWTGSGKDLHADALGRQTVSYDVFSRMMEQWREEGATFEQVAVTVAETHGLDNLQPHELAMLKKAYAESMAGAEVGGDDMMSLMMYGAYDPLAVMCQRLLAWRAGFGWNSFSHTASPVSTTAQGPGSDALDGYHDNTDIPKVMARAMGLEWSSVTAEEVSSEDAPEVVSAAAE